MRCYIRLLLVSLLLYVAAAAYPQQINRPLQKRIIVKTNILNLMAQRPAVSLEKALTKSFSAEVSYVQGQYNHFFLTDHYDYYGFLVRAKKYFINPGFEKVCPYAAIYAGNLVRHIQTKGRTYIPFLFEFRSRNFSANSARMGGSFGIAYFTKSRLIIDGQGSLGYGRYLHLNLDDTNTYAKGYPDVQLWLSIGYCF